ncbi:hypothetical protein PV04_07414 [Phialophora macrospora]|uniref:Uncharacterized protein n=1 Tax=Phialophora macrospora TaxID=1851006 RepID=A0A0D2CIR9_9EURO|nr:hypothetical protein PV04_07414 [Phialophora macrospora]
MIFECTSSSTVKRQSRLAFNVLEGKHGQETLLLRSSCFAASNQSTDNGAKHVVRWLACVSGWERVLGQGGETILQSLIDLSSPCRIGEAVFQKCGNNPSVDKYEVTWGLNESSATVVHTRKHPTLTLRLDTTSDATLHSETSRPKRTTRTWVPQDLHVDVDVRSTACFGWKTTFQLLKPNMDPFDG